jgi:hypothetical protein
VGRKKMVCSVDLSSFGRMGQEAVICRLEHAWVGGSGNLGAPVGGVGRLQVELLRKTDLRRGQSSMKEPLLFNELLVHV